VISFWDIHHCQASDGKRASNFFPEIRVYVYETCGPSQLSKVVTYKKKRVQYPTERGQQSITRPDEDARSRKLIKEM
jgi:hypothetical protein